MIPMKLPLYHSITDLEIKRSLDEQYKVLFNIVEKHNPELCLKLITDELEEFHHILWEMPFIDKIYKVSSKESFFRKEDIFCQIKDSISYSTELLRMVKFTKTKKLFDKKWNIEKELVSIRSPSSEFVELFDKILSTDALEIDDMTHDLKEQILYSRLL